MKIKDELDSIQKKLLGYVLIFLFFPIFLYSNPTSLNDNFFSLSRLVTGTVLNQNMEPLIGASIFIKGTNVGTSTDSEGIFSLQITADTSIILVVSYIGYATREIEVYQESEILITLTESISQLEELVVVGYGIQNNSRLSAAVDQVKVEKLEVDRRPVASLESALVGVAPGLIIEPTDGQLGGEVNIRVREASALVERNALILVDGFESTIRNLNPFDIESVSILKDAAATSIYGARGANGVVLITTKATKRNQVPNITLSSNLAWQQPISTPDIVDSETYMRRFNEAQMAEANRIGETFIPTYTAEDIARAVNGFYPETNWAEELYNESALQSSNNLSINGGMDKFGYLLSAGYLTQDGVSQGVDNLERFTLRAKVDVDVTNWLTIGTNIFNANSNLTNVPVTTDPGLQGQPFFPVQVASGEYEGVYVFEGTTSSELNPVARARSGSFDKTTTDELNTQLYGQIKPLQGLVLEGRVSYVTTNEERLIWNNPYEYIELDERTLEPIAPPISFATADRNLVNVSQRYKRFNSLLTINYEKSFQKGHFLNALIGFQAQEGRTSLLSAQRSDFISPNLPSLNLGSRIEGFGNHSAITNSPSTISYFSRLSYDFQRKYLLEANFRADASSNFIRNKWGYFPSISFGWNMHNEPFLKNNASITTMKLRLSYGISGDDGSISGVEIVDSNPLGIAFGNSTEPTILLSNTTNPNLTWETSKKTNLGIFVELLNGKLFFSGDYYIDNRSDIITSRFTAFESGLTSLDGDNLIGGILDNSYNARSSGWELMVGHQNNYGKIKVVANANLSYYNSEITKGAGMAALSLDPANYQIEGLPIRGNWYGYETDGYFNTQAELDAWAVDQSDVVTQGENGKYLGGYRFIDQLTIDTDGDGIVDESDGVITPDDRVVLRSNAADNYRLGASIGFAYEGFSISARLYGVLNAYEWWNKRTIVNVFNNGRAPYNFRLDTWNSNNTDAEFSEIFVDVNPLAINDVSNLIKERAYIKLKNINIGYSLSPTQLNRIKGIKGLNVYLSFENLGVLWSNYPAHEFGFDPEFGADGFVYPQSLKSSFGVNLTF